MDKEQAINEFLERGVEHIYPSKEFLRERLLSGKKLSMYLGIDPTGPTLHLGSIVPILKLAQFQKLGHQAILLIGDFTATIGDPTDKMSARVPLTHEQVLKNSKHYKKQASSIISFGWSNPAKLKYNSKWLNSLSMMDISKLLSYITYAQTIKRDMFQKRIEEGKDLYLNEFLYPAMQGFDSVAMDVDGEVGGNDQTFNMLMGRDLLKRMKNKEKFVITMKLLTDSEGKKMGKTEGNMATLEDAPEEMFGKVMSWTDGMILPAFELCTKLPLSEISKIKNEMEKGGNPRDAKMFLGETVVKMFYGEKKALQTREKFQKTFSDKKIPDDIKEFKTVAGALLSDCLISAEVVASKTEWRRLVEDGAVGFFAPDGSLQKISDPNFKINSSKTFKIGKHRFLKVII